jgi:prevent-host-death family protein
VAIIKPISDLRNKARSLSRLCRESGEPVYITKNGEGELVLMSLAAYERLEAQVNLFRQLEEAEADVRAGDRGVGIRAVRRRLKRAR